MVTMSCHWMRFKVEEDERGEMSVDRWTHSTEQEGQVSGPIVQTSLVTGSGVVGSIPSVDLDVQPLIQLLFLSSRS
jgi:hypothetical protein